MANGSLAHLWFSLRPPRLRVPHSLAFFASVGSSDLYRAAKGYARDCCHSLNASSHWLRFLELRRYNNVWPIWCLSSISVSLADCWPRCY